MKRIYFIVCMLFSSLSVFCNQDTPAEHNNTPEHYVTVGDEHCTDNDATETTDKHITDIMALVMNIIEHPTDIKLIIHNVSHIMSDLFHMVLHIFDSTENNPAKNALIIKKYCAHLDEETQAHITALITEKIAAHKRALKIDDAVPYKANKNEEEKIVLNHFAHIVGSVFNILRDPENKDVIVTNIVNIIGNTAQIALLGHKSGTLIDHADVDEYVAHIKDDTKIAIGAMITQAVS